MAKNVGKFWNIATNKETKKADISIYGAITKWAWSELGEVSSQAFLKELNNLKDVDTIHLNLNCPGGDVYEAHAMSNSFRRFASENNIKTICNIDGAAFSAASYLAMSCSEIRMGIGSTMMIHNAKGSSRGESKDLRETADLLDKIKESIIDVYMTKTNKSREEIAEMMDKTTWMNPEEALENGFIDKIETYSNEEPATNFSDFDIVNFYDNVPQEIIDKMKGVQPENTVKPELNIKPQKKGGKIMKYEQFKNEHPELFNQIVQEGMETGVKNERARIQNLDNLKNVPDGAREIVNNAKYVEFKNAGEVALEIMNSDVYKATKEINKREEDFTNSGGAKIPESTPPENKEELDEEILNAATQSFTNGINQ
ncbi:head maturation protease, ClpP-related [Psychrilyobacter sp.]|uniref:head maturation protease, ClpP-related n=1 Tax=Psychrilyobacter sp. TaxID=2586924 RepID=UPI003015BD5C